MMSELFQLPSRLDCISNELTEQHHIRLFLKRDDLIHPEISGNKWRKLKYNIAEAQRQQKDTLLTFGGAYSNHITATAAAGKYLGFKTIGIIRGEEYIPLNPSLQFAKDCGMELIYLHRELYKNKKIDSLLLEPYYSSLISRAYIIPEGGANELALKGCAEIVDELQEMDFDYICCACGTGTTLAGIASALKPSQKTIGFAVLKHDTLREDIHQLAPELNADISIFYAHYGGYAKTTPELLQFIRDFQQQHAIPLDYVYTGKMMFSLFDWIAKDYFPPGATIIAVHTGGVLNAPVK